MMNYLIELSICAFLLWKIVAAQVNITPINSASNGETVSLTCTITGFTFPASWTNNDNGVSLTSCFNTGSCSPSNDGVRYVFSATTASITVTISGFSSALDTFTWKCEHNGHVATYRITAASVATSATTAAAGAAAGGTISFLGVTVIVIFMIMIFCGCLDCCKCCRIFGHYEKYQDIVNHETKCYSSWYCLEKGCCSCFSCRPGSKKGNFFCDQCIEKCCGCCLSCRKTCGCGWPKCCKINKETRCCGSCICTCCVDGLKDEDDAFIVNIDMDLPARIGEQTR